MAKTVCIVGAGPGGIAAAKAFIYPEGAFKITIFEQLPRIGGLWPSNASDKGLINPSMSTNLSRYTVCFSDKAWQGNDPSHAFSMFPKASDVGQYLQQYVEKYLNNPSVEIRTSCRVEEASMEDYALKPKNWRIRVRRIPPGNNRPIPPGFGDLSVKSGPGDPEIEEHSFDHVIISSGFFGKPLIPKAFMPKKDSPIPIIHSSEYCGLRELLKDNKGPPGKILIVGGSMSGAETASTIAMQISSEMYSPEKSDIESVEQYTVHHVSSKPFWTLPLFLPLKTQIDDEEADDGKVFNPAPQFLPLDMVMFNLNNRSPEERLKNRSGIIGLEAAQKSHNAFRLFNGGRTAAHASLPSDRDTDAPWLAISDTYSSFVQSGAIKISRGRVKSVADDHKSVIIETPSSTDIVNNISAIIFATGFDNASSLCFLPESVLSTLGYDPSTPDLPLDLSLHSTIHPSIPSLGFVGFYRGPYWGVAEQQAALLRALWLPQTSPPPSLRSALENATSPIPALRKCQKDAPERLTQFPMGDYTHIMESFREMQGYKPVLADDSNCTPVTPALYAVDSRDINSRGEVTESQELLRLVKHEINASRSGKFVAKAIFRSFQGNWVLNRTIKSNISTYPSGSFVGTAKFHPRRPTDEGFAAEYLYVEDGDFKTETGMQFRATRRYVYRYAEPEDKLSVWFVKTDNKTVDYLFHKLEIICPHPAPIEQTTDALQETGGHNSGNLEPEKDRRWKATSHHLCIDDTYDPEYEFSIRGVEVETWKVGYHVKGPQKDYWIGSSFTR